jgi:hypothetical protein
VPERFARSADRSRGGVAQVTTAAEQPLAADGFLGADTWSATANREGTQRHPDYDAQIRQDVYNFARLLHRRHIYREAERRQPGWRERLPISASGTHRYLRSPTRRK